MQLSTLLNIRSHTDQLDALLKNTRDDPKAFYAAGGRNHFFRLETLARLAGGLSDKDQFKNDLALFKKAEDLIGQYDFYAAYLTIFSENKKCHQTFVGIYSEHLREKEAALSDLLNYWTGKEAAQALAGFYRRCDEISFEDEASFTKQLSRFIIKALRKIVRDYDEGVYNTSDFEAGLHELRRKLRWISLYAQVTGGIVQHKPSDRTASTFEKYQTKEIMSSPFMKLPAHASFSHPVILRTATYAALSWMIATLGRYKDHALSLHLFSAETTLRNCYEKLTPEDLSEKQILNKVNELSKMFFEEDRIPEEIIHDLSAYS